MNIQVLFFGITTDLVATSNLSLEIAKDSTVADFKILLREKFLQLENIASYAIAVNEDYAIDELVLKENDTVAVIPPVSGG